MYNFLIKLAVTITLLLLFTISSSPMETHTSILPIGRYKRRILLLTNLEGCHSKEVDEKDKLTQSHDVRVTLAKESRTDVKLDFILVLNRPPSDSLDTRSYIIGDNEFFIPAYTLPSDSYVLHINAHTLDGKTSLEVDHDRCYFNFPPPSVKAAITPGGAKRTASTSTDLQIFGNDSFDYYKVWFPHKQREMSYTWKCNPKPKSKFCNQPKQVVGHQSNLMVPKDQLIDGDVFEITLTVSAKEKSGHRVTDEIVQTIEVHKVATLLIECQKNCPPAKSNCKQITILKVRCKEECTDIKSEHYEWTISSSDPNFHFDYEKNTKSGRVGEKFSIKPNALTPNTYNVSVKLLPKSQQEASNSTTLIFFKPPIKVTCSIKPPKGESVVTKFMLKCEQKKGSYFELYANDDMIICGKAPGVFKQHFPLPQSKNRKFRVKVYDKSKSSNFIPVSVEASTHFKQQSDHDMMKNLDDMYSKTRKYFTNKDHSKSEFALIKAQVMLDEIQDWNLKDAESWTNNFIGLLAKDLLQVNPTTIPDIQHLATIITKLTPSKTIPDTAKDISDLCKKVSLAYLDMIKAHKDATEHHENAAEITKILTKCSSCLSKPNADAIKETKLKVTTEAPTVTDATITENYPDYEIVDEKFHKEMENMKNSTRSILTTSMATAKTMAMTMSKDAGIVKITGGNMTITVYKATGDEFLTGPIDGDGIEISISQDFHGDKHLYDLLMCSFDEDIFWWNPAHTRVCTSIFNGQIWHASCKKRVASFTKPFGLCFHRSKGYHFNETMNNISVKVPGNVSKLKEAQLNPFIKVIRVSLANRTKLSVKFYGLPDTGQFDVVITKFKYPTYEDFLDKIDVRQNEAREVSFVNYETYNIWCYLGILSSRNVNFNVSFTMGLCIQWGMSTLRWEHECDVSHHSTQDCVISCQCATLNSIAGYFQNLPIVPLSVETLKFTLELELYWMVFLTVTTVLTLYIMIILCLLVKKRTGYYFLSDNSPPDRFAYLLVVRTGSARNSGTTSQIAVLISGALSTSRSHVLNYPDPELRLLQTGTEDVFVLTTREHLGNIKFMIIWFNSEGCSPSWYCDDIFLYDMQTKSYWVFDVSTNFSLTEDGKSKAVVKPLTKEEFMTRKKWFRKVKLCDEHHTCVCTRSDPNFDLFKRSTVIISDILLTFVLVLYMMDVLTLEMNYSLDHYTHYYIDLKEIQIALVVSLIVFPIHFTLSWIFRSARLQYSYMQDEVPVRFAAAVASWVILTMIITISLTILILFGFWVPIMTACVWLTISAIAIILQFAVYENLLVTLRRLFVPDRKIVYFERIYASIVDEIETQRSLLYDYFGNVKLMRPYLQHIYTPLDFKKVKLKIRLAKRRATIIKQLEDLALFSIYIFILYAVVLMNKYGDTAMSKTAVYDMVNGELSRTPTFMDVANVRGIYSYINDTLIMVLLSSRWYDNYSEHDPGMLVDFSHKIIGIARLRQNRVKKGVCKVPKEMQFLHMNCEPEVDGDVIDRDSYSYGWSKYDKQYENDRLFPIWSYSSEELTEALPIQGEFALYSGGGYMSFLGRTLYNTYVNMKMMFERYWIGEETRNVFIEFLVYSPNTNLFNSVRLIFEQSATGYVTKDIRIYPARMLLVSEDIELVIMILSFCFVAWVFVLFIKQSVGFIKRFRTFYKDAWFLTDFMIIIVSFVCIALMITRIRKVKKYLNQIEKAKHNEFVPYFSMFYLEDLLSVFAAILICIATIRLWKFLRFVLMFRIFERTLSLSVRGFVALLVVLFFMGSAFAFSGFILYGYEEEDFYCATNVIKFVIMMTFHPDKLKHYEKYPSARIYFTISVIVNLIYLNIFIVTLMTNYIRAQLELHSHRSTYNVPQYLKEQVHYLPKLLRAKLIRLRGGFREEDESPIQSKAEEVRYSMQSITNSSLKTMFHIMKCFIRNNRRQTQSPSDLSQSDIDLMLDVCRLMVHPKIEDFNYVVFYQIHFEKSKPALVSDQRLDQMVQLVEGMLNEEPKKRESPRPTRRHAVPSKIIKESQDTLKKCAMALSVMDYKLQECINKL